MSRTNRKLPAWANEKRYDKEFMHKWSRGLVSASKSDVRRDGGKLMYSEIWDQKAKKAAKKMHHKALRNQAIDTEE